MAQVVFNGLVQGLLLAVAAVAFSLIYLATRRVLLAALALGQVTVRQVWNAPRLDVVIVGALVGVIALLWTVRAFQSVWRLEDEDGKMLEFPWCYDRKAAEQVERNACWVREFLAGFGPKDLVVQPVIVVPGWYVKAKGNYPVKAMNAKYLVGYLKGAGRVFSPEELETTMRRLDERCRVVEF